MSEWTGCRMYGEGGGSEGGTWDLIVSKLYTPLKKSLPDRILRCKKFARLDAFMVGAG